MNTPVWAAQTQLAHNHVTISDDGYVAGSGGAVKRPRYRHVQQPDWRGNPASGALILAAFG